MYLHDLDRLISNIAKRGKSFSLSISLSGSPEDISEALDLFVLKEVKKGNIKIEDFEDVSISEALYKELKEAFKELGQDDSVLNNLVYLNNEKDDETQDDEEDQHEHCQHGCRHKIKEDENSCNNLTELRQKLKEVFEKHAVKEKTEKVYQKAQEKFEKVKQKADPVFEQAAKSVTSSLGKLWSDIEFLHLRENVFNKNKVLKDFISQLEKGEWEYDDASHALKNDHYFVSIMPNKYVISPSINEQDKEAQYAYIIVTIDDIEFYIIQEGEKLLTEELRNNAVAFDYLAKLISKHLPQQQDLEKDLFEKVVELLAQGADGWSFLDDFSLGNTQKNIRLLKGFDGQKGAYFYLETKGKDFTLYKSKNVELFEKLEQAFAQASRDLRKRFVENMLG